MGYKMQVTTVEDIYLTYYKQCSYNPIILNASQTLKEIVEISGIYSHNVEFDWDDMDWILKKTKHWFYNYSEGQHHQNISLESYLVYLKSQLQDFWKYKHHKEKWTSKNKILKKVAELKWDSENENLCINDRLVLSVESKLCDLPNTKYNYYNKTLSIALENRIKLWNNPPLTVKQIVNWPYIGFILNLPHISIVHQTDHAFDRYICLQSCKEILQATKECTAPNSNFNRTKGIQYCNIELATLYICLCRQAITKFSNVCSRRKEELSILFETVIRTLAFCKSRTILCHNDYHYIPTQYKLFREHNASHAKENFDKADNKQHKLIEITRPSFKLTITQYDFDQEYSGTQQEKLESICNLFDEKNSACDERFMELINNDIPYTCSYCNIKFIESSFYAMENHIHDVHGGEDVPWSCMGCNEKFTTYDMSTHNWRHICK